MIRAEEEGRALPEVHDPSDLGSTESDSSDTVLWKKLQEEKPALRKQTMRAMEHYHKLQVGWHKRNKEMQTKVDLARKRRGKRSQVEILQEQENANLLKTQQQEMKRESEDMISVRSAMAKQENIDRVQMLREQQKKMAPLVAREKMHKRKAQKVKTRMMQKAWKAIQEKEKQQQEELARRDHQQQVRLRQATSEEFWEQKELGEVLSSANHVYTHSQAKRLAKKMAAHTMYVKESNSKEVASKAEDRAKAKHYYQKLQDTRQTKKALWVSEQIEAWEGPGSNTGEQRALFKKASSVQSN